MVMPRPGCSCRCVLALMPSFQCLKAMKKHVHGFVCQHPVCYPFACPQTAEQVQATSAQRAALVAQLTREEAASRAALDTLKAVRGRGMWERTWQPTN